MAEWSVARRGTDSSGRGIYASEFMWNWWQQVLADPLVSSFADHVVITQGAWMTLAGGGAGASAGYHDGGGCFDLRVWNLTDIEVRDTVAAIRRNGAAAWLRNVAHGGFTDPHIHLVLGTDHDLDDGAAYQWREYLIGRDGMGGADYHPRPRPLVTKPPEADMPLNKDDLDKVRAIADKAVADATPAIAAAVAKAVLDSDVIGKLDVSVREVLRAEFKNAGGKV